MLADCMSSSLVASSYSNSTPAGGGSDYEAGAAWSGLVDASQASEAARRAAEPVRRWAGTVSLISIFREAFGDSFKNEKQKGSWCSQSARSHPGSHSPPANGQALLDSHDPPRGGCGRCQRSSRPPSVRASWPPWLKAICSSVPSRPVSAEGPAGSGELRAASCHCACANRRSLVAVRQANPWTVVRAGIVEAYVGTAVRQVSAGFECDDLWRQGPTANRL